jgi:hypothetical protein
MNLYIFHKSTFFSVTQDKFMHHKVTKDTKNCKSAFYKFDFMSFVPLWCINLKGEF